MGFNALIGCDIKARLIFIFSFGEPIRINIYICVGYVKIKVLWFILSYKKGLCFLKTWGM